MKPAVLSRMERYFHWAGTKDHKAKEYGLRLIAEVRRLEQLIPQPPTRSTDADTAEPRSTRPPPWAFGPNP